MLSTIIDVDHDVNNFVLSTFDKRKSPNTKSPFENYS